MNFLFNMRISQKIMALVAGLVLGFIAIGVTYFVQVNLQTKQAAERTALNEAQAQLMTLALYPNALITLARIFEFLSDWKICPIQ